MYAREEWQAARTHSRAAQFYGYRVIGPIKLSSEILTIPELVGPEDTVLHSLKCPVPDELREAFGHCHEGEWVR